MKYTHVGINVTNLEKSMEFYENVFGCKPVKVKNDYVKFLLEKPGLNFTLNISDEVTGNRLNHFGFQVESVEEVLMYKNRLEKEGLKTRDEMNVTCCYYVQDKFWITDPDGNEWEFFFTKSDSDVHSLKSSSCCETDDCCTTNNKCC